jgi:hypothetical protein
MEFIKNIAINASKAEMAPAWKFNISIGASQLKRPGYPAF